mgnify:CR=1 FL=1
MPGFPEPAGLRGRRAVHGDSEPGGRISRGEIIGQFVNQKIKGDRAYAHPGLSRAWSRAAAPGRAGAGGARPG